MLFQRAFAELFIDITEINVRIRCLDSNIKLVNVLKNNKTNIFSTGKNNYKLISNYTEFGF